MNHLQNPKYITYRNNAEKGLSHGHDRQHTPKIW